MAVVILNGTELNKLVADVNGFRLAGYVPACGLSYVKGVFYQPMITGNSAAVYGIIDETTDIAFQSGANYASESLGAAALGDMLIINGRFIQAFGDQTANTSDAFDASVLAIINAATKADPDYVGLTAYVYSIVNGTSDPEDPTIAGLVALIEAVIAANNNVFRASFTTTSTELTQLVTAANTPQVVTFNTQQIPNANLGTLDNATGVFTAARNIQGMLTLSAQVRRGTAGATTWAIQVETSTDGVTWTAVTGSLRQVRLSATETNVTRVIDFTTVINLPAGTRLRFTQMVDTAANEMGIVALAASLGGTTAAGFIMGLYTVG